jgi:nucleotide-binding universal stress UspA family protein
MPLKDLLVHVGTDPACAARVDVAIDLAAAHDAHLTGIHILVWPVIPPYIAAELPHEAHDIQGRHLREAAERARALFEERARLGGVRHEWRAIEGDLIETMTLHARYSDLTVVGQGIDSGEHERGLSALPAELALAVGRPVLVVPRYGTFASLGERVLVGWNGSREATRAVNDAIPILRRAGKVTVLTVDPEEEPSRRVAGADISLHLARHGISAEAASTPAAAIAVGDALLSYAADLVADLIVMGGYGHSRLRERILGGVTRHLLQSMTVPVLMSH